MCQNRKPRCSKKDSSMEIIYEFLAKCMSRRPVLILFTTLFLASVFTWLGLHQNGLPQFDDPYLGFQTRFTSISNRLTTLENFRNDLNRLRTIENYPGEKITEKEFRRRKRSDESLEDTAISGTSCAVFPLEDYARVAVKLDSSANIFSEETISLICYFQKLVEEISSYSHFCEIDDDKRCCPMWSLPNYVTTWSNKSDCADLEKDDILNFQNNLNICVQLHLNETMVEECAFHRSTCPLMCQNGGLFHTALLNTMDKSYLLNKEAKYSMIILPVAKSSVLQPEMENLQKMITMIRMPNRHVSLTGFDFGGKDSLFKTYLIWDLQYVILASILIFIVVCFYTMSIFVSAISFGALVLSLGVTYYFYSSVFCIPYFPFMNMLVTIIVLGIGTDGTLILSVAWQRCKKENQIMSELREHILFRVLKESSATLLITTCTTAVAFFASLTSSITTIKCFSVFAGTAIIISFILIYICVPTALVLIDWFWSYLRSLIPSEIEDQKFLSKLLKFYKKIRRLEKIYFRTIPAKLQISQKLVTTKAIRITCFLFFSAILIWACIVVFHFPKFQLPHSEQFQLLTNSHPVEKFDSEVKSRFAEGSSASGSGTHQEDLMAVYFIWGLRDVDNGFGMDPTDDETLEFDPNFSLSSSESQKWMRKLCKKIQKQPFYDQVTNSVTGSNLDSCFMDTMVNWMKRDCEHFLIKNETLKPCCKSSKFPYEEAVLSQCIGLAARDVYRTPAFYFRGDLAGPKFFLMENERNVTAKLATFTVRIKTNVPFTLVYEKINAFYEQIEKFHRDVMKNAPKSLQNGFFVSAHLDFYDLQNSLTRDTWHSVLLSVGFCFILILVSSLKFSVAFGAVIAILATVIVSSAILIQHFEWKLGVFESIAITVAVGLSDFTAHHSLEFSKTKSVTNMMSPTFFSAICTVIMGLFMMTFSSVLVYQQIGSFFFVLVIVSWLYSVFFLSPILTIFDIFVRKVSAGFKFIFPSDKHPNDVSIVNDDSNSNCELDCEESAQTVRKCNTVQSTSANLNISSTTTNDKKQSIMMEKWKLLKKFAQETTV